MSRPQKPVRPRARLGDGGLVANVPIRSVVQAGATRVDILTLDPGPPITRARADDSDVLGGGTYRPRSGLRILGDVLDASMDAQVERDLAMLELINRLVDEDPNGELKAAGLCRVDCRVFGPRPGDDLGRLLDFGSAHLRELVDRGIAAGREAVQ